MLTDTEGLQALALRLAEEDCPPRCMGLHCPKHADGTFDPWVNCRANDEEGHIGDKMAVECWVEWAKDGGGR